MATESVDHSPVLKSRNGHGSYLWISPHRKNPLSFTSPQELLDPALAELTVGFFNTV
jgi:hypothetical protein